MVGIAHVACKVGISLYYSYSQTYRGEPQTISYSKVFSYVKMASSKYGTKSQIYQIAVSKYSEFFSCLTQIAEFFTQNLQLVQTQTQIKTFSIHRKNMIFTS